MNTLKQLIFLSLVCLFVNVNYGQPPSKKIRKLERSKTASVVIKVFLDSMNSKLGGGIIFLEQKDSLYIITADQLLEFPNSKEVKPSTHPIAVKFWNETSYVNSVKILKRNTVLGYAIIRVKKPNRRYNWYNDYGSFNKSLLPKKKSEKKKNMYINDKVELIIGRGDWINSGLDHHGVIIGKDGLFHAANFSNLGVDLSFVGGPCFTKDGFAGILLGPTGYDDQVMNFLTATAVYEDIEAFSNEDLEPNFKYPKISPYLNVNTHKHSLERVDDGSIGRIEAPRRRISVQDTLQTTPNGFRYNFEAGLDFKLSHSTFVIFRIEYFKILTNSLLITGITDEKAEKKSESVFTTQLLNTYQNTIFQIGADFSWVYSLGDENNSGNSLSIGLTYAYQKPELNFGDGQGFMPISGFYNFERRSTIGLSLGAERTYFNYRSEPNRKRGSVGVRLTLYSSDFIDHPRFDRANFFGMDALYELYWHLDIFTFSKYKTKKLKLNF